MKVTFVLPGMSEEPVGGYKIVFQYANALHERGHDVALAFLSGGSEFRWHSGMRLATHIVKSAMRRHGPSSISWFPLHGDVAIVPRVWSPRQLPSGDAVVATGLSTAWFTSYAQASAGRQCYFVQGYETFSRPEATVRESYHLPMKLMAVSSYLTSIIMKETGRSVALIPNFYDASEFYLETTLQGRPNSVALLAHPSLTKRTELGLKVLARVRDQCQGLTAQVFGRGPSGLEYPPWAVCHGMSTPDHLRSKVYNVAKVYFMPSVLEGWPLPPMEAMACGATFVGSDIPALQDFAKSGRNCLLCPPDDEAAFGEAILGVLTGDALRSQLASEALLDVREFTISRSVQKLESAMWG